jgi:hypothetical protein
MPPQMVCPQGLCQPRISALVVAKHVRHMCSHCVSGCHYTSGAASLALQRHFGARGSGRKPGACRPDMTAATARCSRAVLLWQLAMHSSLWGRPTAACCTHNAYLRGWPHIIEVSVTMAGRGACTSGPRQEVLLLACQVHLTQVALQPSARCCLGWTGQCVQSWPSVAPRNNSLPCCPSSGGISDLSAPESDYQVYGDSYGRTTPDTKTLAQQEASRRVRAVRRLPVTIKLHIARQLPRRVANDQAGSDG